MRTLSYSTFHLGKYNIEFFEKGKKLVIYEFYLDGKELKKKKIFSTVDKKPKKLDNGSMESNKTQSKR